MMDCGHCGSDQIVMIEGVYICNILPQMPSRGLLRLRI